MPFLEKANGQIASFTLTKFDYNVIKRSKYDGRQFRVTISNKTALCSSYLKKRKFESENSGSIKELLCHTLISLQRER